MPIYEYKCQKCGHKFEELVMGEKKIKCPYCKSADLKKLISSFSALGESSISSSSSSCSSGTCPLV